MEANIMFCKKCGKEIPNNAKFCTHCGNKTEPAQPVVPEKNVPVQQEVKPTRKKKTALVIIIVVVAVLALIGVGIFAVSRLIDELSFNDSSFVEEKIDFVEEDEEKAPDFEDPIEEPAIEETEAPTEEATKAPEEATEAAPTEDNTPSTEEILAEAAVLAESGDFPGAVGLLQQAQAMFGSDPELQAVCDMYQAYIEAAATEATAPEFLTTADILSDDSIMPLIEEAYLLRGEANAKWDNETEIPGEYTYHGYVYLEDPENWDNNRIYLVFVLNATIKDTPIQFINWVYYDDIVFDNQGIISYSDVGTASDDDYLVETGFGSYYSYHGLEDYGQFFEKIILSSDYELVVEDVEEIVIDHPVSDTYN